MILSNNINNESRSQRASWEEVKSPESLLTLEGGRRRLQDGSSRSRRAAQDQVRRRRDARRDAVRFGAVRLHAVVSLLCRCARHWLPPPAPPPQIHPANPLELITVQNLYHKSRRGHMRYFTKIPRFKRSSKSKLDAEQWQPSACIARLRGPNFPRTTSCGLFEGIKSTKRSNRFENIKHKVWTRAKVGDTTLYLRQRKTYTSSVRFPEGKSMTSKS